MENIPRVLAGRYEVGELIGRGGMAEVYIGYDSRLSRTVAIKLLRTDLAEDPTFHARFRREAQSAAALNHPAIVAVYDTGEEAVANPSGKSSTLPFIVMEYVEGHTVRELLKDGAAVPIDEAVEIVVGVLGALEYAHNEGIVHRDIKPGNIMLTPTGQVKVMDFGIARAMADQSATMTQTNSVVGTAQYLSPEQARGEVVDARSDLYSTGCVLFELLTGQPPFSGDSAVSVAYQHVRELPPTPSSIAGDIPDSLDRVVLKALAKDKNARYADAGAFRSDLLAVLHGGRVGAPATTTWLPAAGAAAAGAAATQVMGAPPADGATNQVSRATSTIPAARPLDDEEEKGSKWWIWVLAILGAALAGWAIWFFAFRETAPDDMIEVPDLEGYTQEDAEAELRDLDLIPILAEEDQREHDPTVAEGNVLRTDPPAGTMIDPAADDAERTITLITSLGPEMVEVPDVIDDTEAAACEAISALGLLCEVSDEPQPHDEIDEGRVMRTDPSAGTQMNPGAENDADRTVTITLSAGPDELTVPDVSGETQARAREILEAQGLSVGNVTTEDAPGVDQNLVVRTSPAAGDPIRRGDPVDLVISSGNVQLPDLTGETEERAREILNGLGLTRLTVEREQRADFDPGQVARQTPGAGIVSVDTEITIWIATAPPDEPDPGDGGDEDEDGG